MSRIKSSIRVAMMGGMLASLIACSESNRNTAPVELVATATVNEGFIDLAAPPDPAAIADIVVRAFTKSNNADIPNDPRFLDVQLRAYRVSYVRTDGGHTVPESFTVDSAQLLTVDSTPTNLDIFTAFQPGAFQQAPFAALIPSNGGIDPETGRRNITMDVRVELFGETLSGQNVFTTARFPVEFCYGCTGV
jgi:hypothetical protein